MWSNRKTRFTVIMSFMIGINLVLLVAHQTFDYTFKDHPNIFFFVFFFDVSAAFWFAVLGVLSSWLLAFRPESYLQTIEESIAKRNTKRKLN